MADPTGGADRGALRLGFDRRLMLQFRSSVITSDGGLLAYRELDDALALTASGGERLAEARTGKNRRHFLVGLLRQSLFERRHPRPEFDHPGKAPLGLGQLKRPTQRCIMDVIRLFDVCGRRLAIKAYRIGQGYGLGA